MKYILMHKEISVCEINISDASFSVESIGKLYNPGHIPPGLSHNDKIDTIKFNRWYKSRSIPASRQAAEEALDLIGIAHRDELILKHYGLSLSDQYWFKPKGSDLRWKDVNFFYNDFSEDVGNALFGNTSGSDNISLVSPDNTSDGWLKKKWTVTGGKRCLIKSGSAPFFQEPLNEKIASVIQRKLNYMPFVDYDLIFDNNYPLSVCENFITPETELISAYSIYETLPKEKNISSYEHFVKCCEIQGIPAVKKFLDYMFAVDYIIANSDRHLRNFGAIRNAETLEWIGFAPLFDCGTSLWFNQIAKI
ncbi:MAG: excisionase [Oscillospiraceae bacterium]|nr:excisionase [Oscillospiraceae bacterium]